LPFYFGYEKRHWFCLSGVNFTKFCAPSKRLLVHSFRQKIYSSISTIFCVDKICPICKVILAKLICRSPNSILQKKASHLVCKKKPWEYVGEIDPWCVKKQAFRCHLNHVRNSFFTFLTLFYLYSLFVLFKHFSTWHFIGGGAGEHHLLFELPLTSCINGML